MKLFFRYSVGKQQLRDMYMSNKKIHNQDYYCHIQRNELPTVYWIMHGFVRYANTKIPRPQNTLKRITKPKRNNENIYGTIAD